MSATDPFDPDRHSPYVLNEDVTVVVEVTDAGGVRYLLRDTGDFRAEMAERFGTDSEEATQPDEHVELTDDHRVRLGIGEVSLPRYTGHPEGPVVDRRGR